MYMDEETEAQSSSRTSQMGWSQMQARLNHTLLGDSWTTELCGGGKHPAGVGRQEQPVRKVLQAH